MSSKIYTAQDFMDAVKAGLSAKHYTFSKKPILSEEEMRAALEAVRALNDESEIIEKEKAFLEACFEDRGVEIKAESSVVTVMKCIGEKRKIILTRPVFRKQKEWLTFTDPYAMPVDFVPWVEAFCRENLEQAEKYRKCAKRMYYLNVEIADLIDQTIGGRKHGRQ